MTDPRRAASEDAPAPGADRADRPGSPPVDYEWHGRTYTQIRQTDPRIAAPIHRALGDARTLVNVGAGTGSYEPDDRWVLAIEPSATMRAQRPPTAAPAINACAEALPLDDQSVDGAMACVTIHHWRSPEAGLAEMRRVARGPVLVLTFDLDHLPVWQQDYLAEGLTVERPRFPSLERIAAWLGEDIRVEHLSTPGDCIDGFFEAYWRRPETLLDAAVRACQSMWALLPAGAEHRIVRRLADDLASGKWDADHGHLRQQENYPGSLRLVISEKRTLT